MKTILRVLFWWAVGIGGLLYLRWVDKHWPGEFPETWAERFAGLFGVIAIWFALYQLWRPVGAPIDDDEPRCPLCKR